MKIRRRISQAARIEMLPLIDIVFLLLVFFIYAMLSMAVHRGLQLDLPASGQAEKSKNSDLSLFIRAGADGTSSYQLGEHPLDPAALEQELKRACNGTDSRPVLIFAEKQLSYQQLYTALDLLNKNGCTTISLQAATK